MTDTQELTASATRTALGIVLALIAAVVLFAAATAAAIAGVLAPATGAGLALGFTAGAGLVILCNLVRLNKQGLGQPQNARVAASAAATAGDWREDGHTHGPASSAAQTGAQRAE